MVMDATVSKRYRGRVKKKETGVATLSSLLYQFLRLRRPRDQRHRAPLVGPLQMTPVPQNVWGGGPP